MPRSLDQRAKRECGLSIVQDSWTRLWILLVETSRATIPGEGKERARKPPMEVSWTRFWILLVEASRATIPRDGKERARKPLMEVSGTRFGILLVEASRATIPGSESEKRVRPPDRGRQPDEVVDTPSGSLACHNPWRVKRECGLSIVEDSWTRFWILLVEASRATTPREGKERARKPLMEVSGTRLWILPVEASRATIPRSESEKRERPLNRGRQLDEVVDTPSGNLASHDPWRVKRETAKTSHGS